MPPEALAHGADDAQLRRLDDPPGNAREVELIGEGRTMLCRYRGGMWFEQQVRDHQGIWTLVWWHLADPTVYGVRGWREVHRA